MRNSRRSSLNSSRNGTSNSLHRSNSRASITVPLRPCIMPSSRRRLMHRGFGRFRRSVARLQLAVLQIFGAQRLQLRAPACSRQNPTLRRSGCRAFNLATQHVCGDRMRVDSDSRGSGAPQYAACECVRVRATATRCCVDSSTSRSVTHGGGLLLELRKLT